MKPAPPERAMPRPPRRFSRLARRSRRLAATVQAGPSLELKVRNQGGRYRAEVSVPSTGGAWRCPHRHLTSASAGQCAGVMARRINRLGWLRATGTQRKIRRARRRSGLIRSRAPVA
jgi:hypothetical protein